MQATFYVPNDKVSETKELVRKYPSMRFLSNPLPIWDNYEFRVEANVSDMEAFMYQRYIRELEGGLTKRAADAGTGWQKFTHWLCGLFTPHR